MKYIHKHKREYYLNHLDILKNKYKLKIITSKFINQRLIKNNKTIKISLNFTVGQIIHGLIFFHIAKILLNQEH